jgi:hypothetical protein
MALKKSIEIKIDEHEEVAKLRQFSSGNEGYGFYGKLDIGGERFQVSLNVVHLAPKVVK